MFGSWEEEHVITNILKLHKAKNSKKTLFYKKHDNVEHKVRQSIEITALSFAPEFSR
jgi:hypothetical protein